MLTNLFYADIVLYMEKINRLLDSDVFCVSDCKAYDNDKDFYVYFKCFDLKTSVFADSDNSILLSDILYDGTLEFCYNKATNEVIVTKIPVIKCDGSSIPIFTSGIAQVVVAKLQKFVSSCDIKLIFSDPLAVFAIDKNVCNVIPSIRDTRNFSLIIGIVEQMAKEEAAFRQKVLNATARKDREDRAKERAAQKKRCFYGIDPVAYKNQEEFFAAVDMKVISMCDKKIANIKRHLKSNEEKYKKMILTCDPRFRIASSKYPHIDELRSYHDKNLFGLTEEEYEAYLEEYLTCRLNNDLSFKGILGIANYVRDEYMVDAIYWAKKSYYGGNINYIFFDEIYRQVLNEKFGHAFGCNLSTFYSNIRERWGDNLCDTIFEFREYGHPIFFPYADNWKYTEFSSSNFRAALNILFNMSALRNQLYFYEFLRLEPSRAKLHFNAVSNWCSAMQTPYWIRMGRDPYPAKFHEKINLFMIKPGVQRVDINKVRYLVQKADRPENVSVNCERLSVTLPNSITQESLIRVIEYAHDCSRDLNFICQSPDLATRVKSYIVDKELIARSREGKYIKGNYFINVDPDYYNSFFADTPDNKTFWHRYDASSEYRYHRKNIYSLDTIIDMAFKDYKNIFSDRVIDYNVVKTMLLGGYYGNPEDTFGNYFTQIEDSRIANLEDVRAQAREDKNKRLVKINCPSNFYSDDEDDFYDEPLPF